MLSCILLIYNTVHNKYPGDYQKILCCKARFTYIKIRRRKSFSNVPEYEKIMNGKTNQKLEVARNFKANLKIQEEISKPK